MFLFSPISYKLEEKRKKKRMGCWQSQAKIRLFALGRSIKIIPY